MVTIQRFTTIFLFEVGEYLDFYNISFQLADAWHRKSKLNSYVLGVRIIVLNAMFNNISVISWRSVLLVDETIVTGENHRLVVSDLQTLSHKPVPSTHRNARDSGL